MKKSRLIIRILCFVFCSIMTNLKADAQWYWDDDDHPLSLEMPQISLVTIMPNTSAITLALGIPNNPGQEPRDNVSEAKDSTKWLNYTSSRKGKKSRRSVDVQITQGSVPEGLKKLQGCASVYSSMLLVDAPKTNIFVPLELKDNPSA